MKVQSRGPRRIMKTSQGKKKVKQYKDDQAFVPGVLVYVERDDYNFRHARKVFTKKNIQRIDVCKENDKDKSSQEQDESSGEDFVTPSLNPKRDYRKKASHWMENDKDKSSQEQDESSGEDFVTPSLNPKRDYRKKASHWMENDKDKSSQEQDESSGEDFVTPSLNPKRDYRKKASHWMENDKDKSSQEQDESSGEDFVTPSLNPKRDYRKKASHWMERAEQRKWRMSILNKSPSTTDSDVCLPTTAPTSKSWKERAKQRKWRMAILKESLTPTDSDVSTAPTSELCKAGLNEVTVENVREVPSRSSSMLPTPEFMRHPHNVEDYMELSLESVPSLGILAQNASTDQQLANTSAGITLEGSCQPASYHVPHGIQVSEMDASRDRTSVNTMTGEPSASTSSCSDIYHLIRFNAQCICNKITIEGTLKISESLENMKQKQRRVQEKHSAFPTTYNEATAATSSAVIIQVGQEKHSSTECTGFPEEEQPVTRGDATEYESEHLHDGEPEFAVPHEEGKKKKKKKTIIYSEEAETSTDISEPEAVCELEPATSDVHEEEMKEKEEQSAARDVTEYESEHIHIGDSKLAVASEEGEGKKKKTQIQSGAKESILAGSVADGVAQCEQQKSVGRPAIPRAESSEIWRPRPEPRPSFDSLRRVTRLLSFEESAAKSKIPVLTKKKVSPKKSVTRNVLKKKVNPKQSVAKNVMKKKEAQKKSAKGNKLQQKKQTRK